MCDTAQPTKWPQHSSPDMPVLLHSNYVLTQPCAAFSDKMGTGLIGFQGTYVALAQTCPAYSEVPVPCAASQQQPNFSGYDADSALNNVHESMGRQAPHGW